MVKCLSWNALSESIDVGFHLGVISVHAVYDGRLAPSFAEGAVPMLPERSQDVSTMPLRGSNALVLLRQCVVNVMAMCR